MEDDLIKYWLDVCSRISDSVEEAIRVSRDDPLVDSVTKMGADGTPTHKIDEYAEDAAISVLESTGRSLILISEEIGTVKIGEDDAEVVIIMDPLDGTTNAMKNIPCYGISIAVALLDGDSSLDSITLDDVVIGFVKNFPMGDVYCGVKGSFATKNGRAIHVSDVSEASKATLSTYIYRTRGSLDRICSGVRRMRIMGAIAVELCYIAEGIYDAFLDIEAVRVLDIAAAQLIIKEAGGYITDTDSNVLSSQIDLLEKTTVIAASNHSLQEDVAGLL